MHRWLPLNNYSLTFANNNYSLTFALINLTSLFHMPKIQKNFHTKMRLVSLISIYIKE